LRVIGAYPLTGVGLGASTNYILRAEPFRVALQYRDEGHPHNSFLEIAAFMGIPALLLFLWLLGGVFRSMLRTYKQATGPDQMLLGGVIIAAVVMCVNSLGINGLTTPALTPLEWLMLGMSASPALLAREKASAFAAAKATSVHMEPDHRTVESAREFDV
jgi:O-antigen ligase